MKYNDLLLKTAIIVTNQNIYSARNSDEKQKWKETSAQIETLRKAYKTERQCRKILSKTKEDNLKKETEHLLRIIQMQIAEIEENLSDFINELTLSKAKVEY